MLHQAAFHFPCIALSESVKTLQLADTASYISFSLWPSQQAVSVSNLTLTSGWTVITTLASRVCQFKHWNKRLQTHVAGQTVQVIERGMNIKSWSMGAEPNPHIINTLAKRDDVTATGSSCSLPCRFTGVCVSVAKERWHHAFGWIHNGRLLNLLCF